MLHVSYLFLVNFSYGRPPSQNFCHTVQCPDPNLCVPKSKPPSMHSLHTCLEDLVEPLTKIRSGEWHVASYARVTSVSRHAHCVAISVKASCNRFTAEYKVQATLDIQRLWEPMAESIGPIVQYATDGDKRRGAVYRSLTHPC